MILNNAPQNEATISNVAEIGEFRIRNSAKAFGILSSSLYANKIRAIIRELSCNAYDSHVAAGNLTTPFDMHPPNQLEPWFSIRDYGVGLTHKQVVDIYTTYFESTKTGSNDFVGALGLGSKTPFSYTDNFTVTAVKDGVRGVYSAFINEAGIPSIALMMSDESTDPNGVEIKFSVNTTEDFTKFAYEAKYALTYFKLRPVVTGYNGFTVTETQYEEKDIIPGVHYLASYHEGSYAIMGNIRYPIDRDAFKEIPTVHKLLGCGLELHFEIGELDFQASREGLSYIAQTVTAISSKVEKLNAQLVIHIAEQAKKIKNRWARAYFLEGKHNQNLYCDAVEKYVTDTKFELFRGRVPNSRNSFYALKVFTLPVSLLAEKYNITATIFKSETRYRKHASMEKPTSVMIGGKSEQANQFYVSSTMKFVLQDTKSGALTRAKYHWANDAATRNEGRHTVAVLSPADKTKPADYAAFLKDLGTPPAKQVFNASALLQAERRTVVRSKNVTITSLQRRCTGGYNQRDEMVWRDSAKLDSFDKGATYYYLPLNGFNVAGFPNQTGKDFAAYLSALHIRGLAHITVYGVRKADLEEVKKLSNWVDLTVKVGEELDAQSESLQLSWMLKRVDQTAGFRYNEAIVTNVGSKNSESLYYKFMSRFTGITAHGRNEYALSSMLGLYPAAKAKFNMSERLTKLDEEIKEINARYPLLRHVGAPVSAVVNYINLVDAAMSKEEVQW